MRFRGRHARWGWLAVLAGGVGVAVALVLALAGGGGSAHQRVRRQAAKPRPARRGGPSRQAAIARGNAWITRTAALGLPIYCAGPRGWDVAFTFDDGPGPYTHLALRKLRRAHERATFFDVGISMNAHPEIVATIDSRDSLGANWKQIIQNVKAGLHPGSIILMHENHGQTIRALTTLLPLLHRRHLHSVSLPELFAVDPPSVAQIRRGLAACWPSGKIAAPIGGA